MENESIEMASKNPANPTTTEQKGRIEALKTWYYSDLGQKARGFVPN